MTSFTQRIPPNSVLVGIGVATQGLRIRVQDAQPIGAPALRGTFELLSAAAAHSAVLDTHLADDVSHNAYVAVLAALPPQGVLASFDDIHSTLVNAVNQEPRLIETINRNLLHRQAWALDTNVEPVGGLAEDFLHYWTKMGTNSLVVGSTDFGEELDDVLALKYGFDKMPCEVHLLVSGGKLTPQQRVDALNTTLDLVECDVWAFNKSKASSGGGSITLHPDVEADVEAMEANTFANATTGRKCSAFVNNGPLTNSGLELVADTVNEHTKLYLVGADALMPQKGGINQNGGGIAWQGFIDVCQKKNALLISLTPNVTRHVRFHKSELLFPPGSHLETVAKRSAFMFAASRPTIPAKFVPPQYSAWKVHFRLNSGNAEICNAWRHEMGLRSSGATRDAAGAKASEYIACLKGDYYFPGGVIPAKCEAFDTKENIDVDMRAAISAKTITVTDDDLNTLSLTTTRQGITLDARYWGALEEVVNTCLLFTFDVGYTEGQPVRPLYRTNCFGFKPEHKLVDDELLKTFIDKAALDYYVDALWSKLISTTPAYDLQAALMAYYGIVDCAASKIPYYQHLVDDASGGSSIGGGAVAIARTLLHTA